MTLPSPSADLTVVVTGASSGIGVEIAREFARRGHGVTLVARREGPMKTLADELASEHGIRAEVVTADLTDVGARTAIATRLDELGLGVSVLVNNAGLSTMGAVHRSDPDREIAMIRTDVEAVAHLCSLFLPQMVERGSGAILNVASTAAFQPIPGQAGYGGCKAFVLSYTHALRGELRGTGVSATALCPGPVETAFAETAGVTQAEAEKSLPKFMWVSPGAVARQAVEALDQGRAVIIPGSPNRIAAVLAYLAPRRLIVPLLAHQHPKLVK